MAKNSNKGGRIAPDGRPAQAPGVGKNAKRHDLERPATPGLHDSDLQQGDVQALEQGQRIAPRSTQRPSDAPARLERQVQRNHPGSSMNQGMQIPDAIDFLGQRNGPEFGPPTPQRRLDSSAALTWLPILRQLAAGPGASSALVNAFINQARLLQQAGAQPATVVDMAAVDDGLEAMLDEGIR